MGVFQTCGRCGSQYVGGFCTSCKPDAPPASKEPSIRGLERLEPLGYGGMGIVYKARQPALNRTVAVKFLRPDRLADPDFGTRFEREARAMAALSHSNIVAVYDFGSDEGGFWLVMEYVDGATLRDHLKTRRIEPDEAVAIVRQVCDALEYAHGEGVVHRDIKPENILLDRRGRVKIADFGLAKVGPDPGLTESGDVLGTAAYMAPEQMESAKQVDSRADLYSAGVVLYELLTGGRPLGRFEPPSKRSPSLSRFDRIVHRALSRSPSDRYSSASEMRSDLLGRPRTRTPVPWIAAAAIVLLAGVALFWKFSRPGPQPAAPRVEKPEEPKKEPALSYVEARALLGHSEGVTCVAYAPDGRLATGGIDRVARIWDPESGQVIREFKGHQHVVTSLAWDGKRLVTGSFDRTARVWDPAKDEPVATIQAGTVHVTAVAISPDGKRLVTGDQGGVVKFWALPDGKPEFGIVYHTALINSLVYGPAGLFVVSGSVDKSLAILDPVHRKAMRSMDHGEAVRCVALSPDGGTVASSSVDSTIRLWSVASGEELAKFSGHEGWVNAVAFHPDGKHLASAGHDTTIRIWEIASGREVQVLRGHGRWVMTLSFRSDGKRLASGSLDGSARIWAAP